MNLGSTAMAEISLEINVRPGRTQLDIKLSFPINDSSCLCDMSVFGRQVLRIAWISISRSCDTSIEWENKD